MRKYALPERANPNNAVTELAVGSSAGAVACPRIDPNLNVGTIYDDVGKPLLGSIVRSHAAFEPGLEEEG